MLDQEPVADLEVKVIWTQGCRNTMQAIDRVEDVAEELGISLTLDTILVNSLEEAREHKLQGSPTILIDGRDIDPARRQSSEYGFT